MAMSDQSQMEPTSEVKLIEQLKILLKDYPEYDPPRVRTDGDIVIPLDVVLKKNREASRNMAEAISNLMNGDKRRSSAWLE
jgi:hypothetical protein